MLKIKSLTVVIICILCVGASLFLSKTIIPHIQAERAQAKKKAALVALDYFNPSFEALVKFEFSQEPLSQEQWMDYLHYFEAVTKALPQLNEGQLLAGFCSYYTQQPQRALEYLRISVDQKSEIFWVYYNLGLITAQSKNYGQAAAAFKIALSLPPQSTLEIIMRSKIYNDIGRPIPNFPQVAVSSLQQGYAQASKILSILQRLVENNDDVNAHQELESFLSTQPLKFL